VVEYGGHTLAAGFTWLTRWQADLGRRGSLRLDLRLPVVKWLRAARGLARAAGRPEEAARPSRGPGPMAESPIRLAPAATFVTGCLEDTAKTSEHVSCLGQSAHRVCRNPSVARLVGVS
jgi:hypothetical protein